MHARQRVSERKRSRGWKKSKNANDLPSKLQNAPGYIFVACCFILIGIQFKFAKVGKIFESLSSRSWHKLGEKRKKKKKKK